MLPNTIIAGTNKAGTTSLFRYLASHPDVATSKIKEISFFSSLDASIDSEALAKYELYFEQCPHDSKILLEASPNYLSRGKSAAKLMKQCLPSAKLIFILREPASKLLSNFERRQQRLDPMFEDLTRKQYIDGISNTIMGVADSPFNADISGVEYSKLIGEYLEYFDKRQILIMFFDDLCHNPRAFTQDVCRFLNIAPGYYDNYKFEIENKTRMYKSKKLQRIAFNVNMTLEPWLNKTPGLRGKLRLIYNVINARKEPRLTPNVVEMDDVAVLAKAFSEKNSQLIQLIIDLYPERKLPYWLLL